MTWARPKSHDVSIKVNRRSEASTLTYVGHNALQGGSEVYWNLNIVNLDMDSFWSKSMCLANHTRATLDYVVDGLKVTLDKRMQSDVNSAKHTIERIMARESGRRQVKSCWSWFFGSSKPATTPNTYAAVSGDTVQDEEALKLKTPDDNSTEAESVTSSDTASLSDDDDSSVCSTDSIDSQLRGQLSIQSIPEGSVEWKEAYLNALEQSIKSAITIEQRVNLLKALLTTDSHPLKKERHYCCGLFLGRSHEESHQTYSMHKAVDMLLRGVTDEEFEGEGVKICQSYRFGLETKITINNQTFNFNRYADFFDRTANTPVRSI